MKRYSTLIFILFITLNTFLVGNAGGNSSNSNAGGNSSNSNAGGNSSDSNAGGNPDNGNNGVSDNSGTNGNAGGNSSNSNAGGNSSDSDSSGNPDNGNNGVSDNSGTNGNAGGNSFDSDNSVFSITAIDIGDDMKDDVEHVKSFIESMTESLVNNINRIEELGQAYGDLEKEFSGLMNDTLSLKEEINSTSSFLKEDYGVDLRETHNLDDYETQLNKYIRENEGVLN